MSTGPSGQKIGFCPALFNALAGRYQAVFGICVVCLPARVSGIPAAFLRVGDRLRSSAFGRLSGAVVWIGA